MNHAIRTLLILVLSASSGCVDSASGPDAGVQVAVDTLNGVVRAHSSGSAPAWTLEPVLRLGSREGGPEEFGRIRSLLADEDGRVYVADNLARTIRVFSEAGEHVRDIGRGGEGPGEFGELYSLAWFGDQLAVMDPGNARISIFSRDGDPLDEFRHFAITGPASLIRLHPLGTEGFQAPVVDPARQRLPWVRHTPAGARDTIPSPTPPSGTESTSAVCPTPDGGLTFISVEQAPGMVWAFPPPGGSVAASWTEEYRIAFLAPDGDTLRVVTRDRPRPPYPDSLWDESMEPYRELRERFPGVQCDPSAPDRPRYRAALRHLLFDDIGRLWVEVASESGFVWEVFDAQGRLLGTADAPPRHPGIPPYVRDGRLHQVEVDDLDVQYVAVYRLVEDG